VKEVVKRARIQEKRMAVALKEVVFSKYSKAKSIKFSPFFICTPLHTLTAGNNYAHNFRYSKNLPMKKILVSSFDSYNSISQ
jgi:hypothetical protein